MSSEKIYYVYVYRHPITMLPFYVGKGKAGRMWAHLNETFENTENRKKYAVIKSLSNQGLSPIIGRYAKNLNEDSAYDLEEMLIKKWGRRDFEPNGLLTNICSGNRPPSADGRTISESTKQKISKSKIGDKNPMYGKSGINSPRYGKPGLQGEQNGFYGKTHTIEIREQISIRNTNVHTGKKRSDETKARMRIARATQVITEESKKKISATSYGRKQTTLTIEKRRHKQIGRPRPSKKWIWTTTSPEGVVYQTQSLSAFCREHSLNEDKMRRAENKSNRIIKGWTIIKNPTS